MLGGRFFIGKNALHLTKKKNTIGIFWWPKPTAVTQKIRIVFLMAQRIVIGGRSPGGHQTKFENNYLFRYLD